MPIGTASAAMPARAAVMPEAVRVVAGTRTRRSGSFGLRDFARAVTNDSPHHPAHGEQVEERGQRAVPEPVLGATERAWTMMYRHFHDVVAGHSQKRRHETVHAGVGRNRADALAAHRAQ